MPIHDWTRVDAGLFQFLGGLRRVLRQDLLDRVREFVLGAVRELAERLNLLQLVAPQLINFVVESQWRPFGCLRWKGDYKQWVRGVLGDASFPLSLRSDTDVSRFFFCRCGQDLDSVAVARTRGGDSRAQY